MLNMDERAKRVKERQSRPRKSRTKAGCLWLRNTEAPTDDFYCIQTHTHTMSSSYEPWLLHEAEGSRNSHRQGDFVGIRVTLGAHLHCASERLRGTCMYSVSQATIKDTLLEASEMPSLGYVTGDHTSDIESPPTPDKCESL